MDNLNPSLSQALPLRDYDAEQVLQAPFRAAALGIATFYKKAAENGRKAYSLGYSSALQDVLEYLQAGLDYGTDQSDSQHSERRMAMTIERVMDYIQRRQDALRAEEPGEDEGVHSTSAPQQQLQSSASASSASSNSTLHPRQPDCQPPPVPPAPERAPSSESEPAPPSSEPAAPLPSSTRRRVSPRRTTPVPFDSAPPSETPSARAPEQLPSPFGPAPSALNLMAHPINLDFSSFVSPLSQLPHPSSGGVAANRRHRGAPGSEARKGKAKERGVVLERERSHGACAGSVGPPVMQLDPMELFPTGYAHYAAVPSAPCGSAEVTAGRVLSSIGNKRRFPLDQPAGHFDPVGLAPAQRLVRRGMAKTVGPAMVDEVVKSDVVTRELGGKSGEDVVMVLGDETSERPSKRVLRKQYQA